MRRAALFRSPSAVDPLRAYLLHRGLLRPSLEQVSQKAKRQHGSAGASVHQPNVGGSINGISSV